MPDKPNCYECKWRGDLPGDAHSRCNHPSAGGGKGDALSEVMAIFAGVGRVGPIIDSAAAQKLEIKGDAHGIRKGWFNWPYNFDPVWLRQCNGFEAKDERRAQAARKMRP